MSIFVIGINHKTAPIRVREKVYFALDKLSLYLQDLLSQGIAQEAVLLSTCNRSELYCNAHEIQSVLHWFCAQTLLSREELEPALYKYRDAKAVAHIMQVACGLDSMILGEPQILGQMKEAFSESCTAGAVDTLFHRLFQQVFSVAKEIRTATAIGACPVSVASAAIHFAKQQVKDFSQANIVLLGAGETNALLIRYLKKEFFKSLSLVNRTPAKAMNLAQEIKGNLYGLEQLSEALLQADIVFSATGSPMPIVSYTLMANVMAARHHRPLVLLDIAVPRDVDPNVATLTHLKLFCIDDLKSIIEHNRRDREHAADKAREMILHKSTEFFVETNSFDKVTHTIRAYRHQIEEICRAELIKAKQQLNQGMDPAWVLDAFSHAFTQKLLHSPSVQLRQAGAEGQVELLKLAKQLFALPDHEIERI